MAEAPGVGMSAGEGSSRPWLQPKKEEVEDFTFDEPCQKKQKTSSACLGRPKASETSGLQALRDKLDMNWDLIEVFYDVITQYKLLAYTKINQCLHASNEALFSRRRKAQFLVTYLHAGQAA